MMKFWGYLDECLLGQELALGRRYAAQGNPRERS